MKKKILISILLFLITVILSEAFLLYAVMCPPHKYNGKVVAYPVKYSQYENGLPITYYGYIDSRGRNIIQPKQGDLFYIQKELNNSDFIEISQIISEKDTNTQNLSSFVPWNFIYSIHSDGGTIVPFSTPDKLAIICSPNQQRSCTIYKCDFANRDFGPILDEEYQSITSLFFGYAKVCKGGFCGIIDKHANIVIPLKYPDEKTSENKNQPYSVSDNFFWDNIFLINGNYVKDNGDPLFNKKFDSENSLPFVENLAWVYETDDSALKNIIRIGYINKKGRYIWSKSSNKKTPLIKN